MDHHLKNMLVAAAFLACGAAGAQAMPDMGKFLATGGVSQVEGAAAAVSCHGR